MINETLKLTGFVTIHVNGEVVKEIPNLVVATGKNFVASRMVGASANVMSHMAIGTDSTAPSSANIALGAEVARVALSGSSVTDNVVNYSATFPAGTGTANLVEAGIFSASSGGTLLCKVNFSQVSKASADIMTISWSVTAS